MERFSFESDIDGWLIQCFKWPVAGAKASVVVAHGMAEHAQRYQRFAEALNQAGFDVVAMDHRAHGCTSGPSGLGDFGDGGWDALVADIEQLVQITRATQPARPVVLFGHSMGAAAAQQYAPLYSHNIDWLVLSGTTLRDPGEPRPYYNAAFQPQRKAYDWLSRDELEVDAYINDPLCGFEGQRVKNGMDRTDPRRVDAELLAKIRNNLPVLLVAGDADPVNRNLQGIHYLIQKWQEAGIQHIASQLYAGGRHEMLNETNRVEVTNNIIQWIERVVANDVLDN